MRSIIRAIQIEPNLKLNKMWLYKMHYLDYLNTIELVEVTRASIDVIEELRVQ